MKTDDDAFVRIDEVLVNLKGKPSNGLLYGLISFDSAPHRDKDSKWHISAEVPISVKFHLHMCSDVFFTESWVHFLKFLHAGMATWQIPTMGSWSWIHHIPRHCRVHCSSPPRKRSSGNIYCIGSSWATVVFSMSLAHQTVFPNINAKTRIYLKWAIDFENASQSAPG